jgi:hypothetical protein
MVTAHPYVCSARSTPIMPYYYLLLVHPTTVMHLRLLLVLLPLPTLAGPHQRPASIVRILKDGVRVGDAAIRDDDAAAGHGATCARELHYVFSGSSFAMSARLSSTCSCGTSAACAHLLTRTILRSLIALSRKVQRVEDKER